VTLRFSTRLDPTLANQPSWQVPSAIPGRRATRSRLPPLKAVNIDARVTAACRSSSGQPSIRRLEFPVA